MSATVWARRPEGASLHALRLDEEYSWATLEEWARVLPTREQDRVSRFRHSMDAQRCLLGRLLTRHVLSTRLDAPVDVEDLGRNLYGRPCLRGWEDWQGDFNLSHSGRWIAFAYSPWGAVGIDVEREREVDPALMDAVYTLEERADVWSGGDPGFRRRFFRQWTLKEAFIKALGYGVSLPLLDFGVRLRGSTAHVYGPATKERAHWRLRYYGGVLEPGYHLALCRQWCEPPVQVQELTVHPTARGPVFVPRWSPGCPARLPSRANGPRHDAYAEALVAVGA